MPELFFFPFLCFCTQKFYNFRVVDSWAALFKKPNDDHHSNPMTETNCDDEVNQLNKE
jgi:hypothetical protein